MKEAKFSNKEWRDFCHLICWLSNYFDFLLANIDQRSTSDWFEGRGDLLLNLLTEELVRLAERPLRVGWEGVNAEEDVAFPTEIAFKQLVTCVIDFPHL